ncbi:glycosyltransferase family 4 protein [bacterium]|nr:glycosyltransferase family 4 protein [candidate division CSSED10-310 bacterium]
MKSERRFKLLFIIQRYGVRVDGGAELYCRWLAEHLKSIYDITVLTTCAEDYTTWHNKYSEGQEDVNGVKVIRCSIDQPRSMDSFNLLTQKLLTRQRTMDEERQWLLEQGPVSTNLLKTLHEIQHQFDYLFFFTYLYYPTVEGTALFPNKSVLVSTAHDEPVAHFQIYHEMYRRVRGLLFLTEAEQTFVNAVYDVQQTPQCLLGTGIDIPEASITPAAFRKKYLIQRPYLLYIGRVDAGKGCSQLIDYFIEFQKTSEFNGILAFAGRQHMIDPEHPDIKFLGFIPDGEIESAIHGSELILVPSSFESLSILLLQGFSLGKPALVNAGSKVLLNHCLSSNAGLFYSSQNEFSYGLELLLTHEKLKQRMGENAKQYIRSFYTWKLVENRLQSFLNALGE